MKPNSGISDFRMILCCHFWLPWPWWPLLLWYFISSWPRCAIPQIGTVEFRKTAANVKGRKNPTATGGLTPVSAHCSFAIPLIVCWRPSMCLFFSTESLFLSHGSAIAEAEMCKKCAMVADGDGWQWPAEMVGIPDQQPSAAKIWGYCHQPILPLPSLSRWKRTME